MKDIQEKDWKHLRSLIDTIVNRFSKESLANIQQIIIAKHITSKHEKYLQIRNYITERDSIFRDFFTGVNRSNAITRIAQIQKSDLIKPEEFNRFSDDVKYRVKSVIDLTSVDEK